MKCHICQKEILKRIEPNRLKRNKHNFCSRKCYIVFWGNEQKGEKNGRWNNSLPTQVCPICKKSFRRGLRHGKLPIYCSWTCRTKSMQGMWMKEKNPRWDGGLNDINSSIRHSEEYIVWRNACGKRDKFKCQFCGASHQKRLVIHHIKTFKKYPELRFSVKNGITLCRGCHIKLHREHRGIYDFTKILNDYMPNIAKA